MKKFSLYDTKISFRQDEEGGGLSRKSYSHYVLFDETMRFLGSIGFYVGEDKEIKKKYPILLKDHRQGRYSDLEFKASRNPAGFEICFYQNVIFENKFGGFYDFDRRKKMPYLIEKQFALTIKNCLNFSYQEEFTMPQRLIIRHPRRKLNLIMLPLCITLKRI